MNNATAIVWWVGVGYADGVDTSLCQLARKLLVMAARSATIVHIFSSFGLIQSKLRNQLGIQKCVKLVSCYGMPREKMN